MGEVGAGTRARRRGLLGLLIAAVAAACLAGGGSASATVLRSSPASVSVDWKHVTTVSKTVPTTQYLGSAWALDSSRFHQRLLQNLQTLHTNDTRVQLWYPLVRQSVAELTAPTAKSTSWNFKYMDQVMVGFFKHTTGAANVNVGTIPEWMFSTPQPVAYPSNPATSDYNYEQGNASQLKDPTGKQFARYEARVFKWYTKGGFTDELGKYHHSGYHFKISYWGVLNEPSIEHAFTVQQYTAVYDAVTAAIHRINPSVKFIGGETGTYSQSFAAYFLNPRNHRPGTPLNFFSFHNYPISGNAPALWQANYFTGTGVYGLTADQLATSLKQLDAIRDADSPHTKIFLDELGTFNTAGGAPTTGAAPYSAFNPLYWVASGANFAANFITAERLGVASISMTQMLGYPTQSESVTMTDWTRASPTRTTGRSR